MFNPSPQELATYNNSHQGIVMSVFPGLVEKGPILLIVMVLVLDLFFVGLVQPKADHPPMTESCLSVEVP